MPPSPPPPAAAPGLSTGIIAGVAVGVVVIVALAATVAWLVLKLRRQEQGAGKQPGAGEAWGNPAVHGDGLDVTPAAVPVYQSSSPSVEAALPAAPAAAYYAASTGSSAGPAAPAGPVRI